MNTQPIQFSPEAEDMHAAASEQQERDDDSALDSHPDNDPEPDAYLDTLHEDRTDGADADFSDGEFFGN